MRGSIETPAAWSEGFSTTVTMGIFLLLILVVLTATSLFLSSWRGGAQTAARRVHCPWWRTFLVTAGQWFVLLLFIPVVGRITAHAPLNRIHWVRSLARHALAILVLSPLHFLITKGMYFLINASVSSWGEAREILHQVPVRVLLSNLCTFPVIYGAMATLCYAWTFRRQEQEKEHHAALLQRQLALAQLQTLRMQLNPHFLFNTLNGIISLMRRDPDTAERMMLALTDFLRSALEEEPGLETPLARELEMVDRYLAIECLRFPGRIRLEREVSEEALRAAIPSFLLQPLVENAIHHGLAPRASGGRLRIQAHLEGNALCLIVEDDGVGHQEGKRQSHGGLGLANARERLFQRYGSQVAFETEAPPRGGFRVSMRLPFEPAESLT